MNKLVVLKKILISEAVFTQKNSRNSEMFSNKIGIDANKLTFLAIFNVILSLASDSL